jgi:hypothetical protein
MVGGYIAIQFGTYKRKLLYMITILTMIGSIANSISIAHVIPKWVWIEIPFYFVIGHYMDKTFKLSKQQPTIEGTNNNNKKLHTD